MSESDELYREARDRYIALKPLSGPELDTVLRWASEKHLDAEKQDTGTATMLVIRLLLAGRADSELSSPKEGHAEVRIREIEQASRK